MGTLCEVYIDHDQIKRIFKADAITVANSKTRFSHGQVKAFFDNEIYWLKKLDSDWIPKTLEIGKNFIIQEYTGPMLLDSISNLPDVYDQVVEMYKFFKKKNVYKRNGSLSNLTMKGDQLVAFDFKWSSSRPNGYDMELKSYREWLSKIDPRLTNELINL